MNFDAEPYEQSFQTWRRFLSLGIRILFPDIWDDLGSVAGFGLGKGISMD